MSLCSFVIPPAFKKQLWLQFECMGCFGNCPCMHHTVDICQATSPLTISLSLTNTHVQTHVPVNVSTPWMTHEEGVQTDIVTACQSAIMEPTQHSYLSTVHTHSQAGEFVVGKLEKHVWILCFSALLSEYYWCVVRNAHCIFLKGISGSSAHSTIFDGYEERIWTFRSLRHSLWRAKSKTWTHLTMGSLWKCYVSVKQQIITTSTQLKGL